MLLCWEQSPSCKVLHFSLTARNFSNKVHLSSANSRRADKIVCFAEDNYYIFLSSFSFHTCSLLSAPPPPLYSLGYWQLNKFALESEISSIVSVASPLQVLILDIKPVGAHMKCAVCTIWQLCPWFLISYPYGCRSEIVGFFLLLLVFDGMWC